MRRLHARWRQVGWSLLLVAAIPFAVDGGLSAWNATHNDVLEWMPGDFQAAKDLAEFGQYFQSDELMMVSWEGQTSRSQAAAELAEALSSSDLFRRVVTPSELLNFFAESPLNLSESQALERTRGWLTNRAGDQCGIIALVSPAGANDRPGAVRVIEDAASSIDVLRGVRLRLAGPSVEAVAVDKASQQGLLMLNLLSFAVCVGMLSCLLRSLRGTLLIFSLAFFNELLCLAIIWHTGAQMDSVLLLSANLTFVLSISIGVHLLNYYFDAQADVALPAAPKAAYDAAIKPTAFSVLTTAIGLLSLTTNSLRPLSKFGLYSALGLGVAAAVMLVYVPLHLELWPLARRRSPAQRTPASDEAARLSQPMRVLCTVATAAAIAVTLIGLVGATRLKTAVGVAELLPSDSPIIQDYRWIEDRIGPLVPVEIVLTASAGDAREMVAQYRVVQATHQELAEAFPNATPVSALNFAAPLPDASRGFRYTVRLAAFRNALAQSEERLAEIGFIRTDAGERRWRISLRTSLFKEQEFGEMLRRVRAIVDQQVRDRGFEEPVSVLVAGGAPLIHQAQQRVLIDLLKSFSLAFILVAVALVVLFRSVARSLLAMIPNLFPIAVLFGLMGWLGFPAEVGTVLTASAALGIAVDDTLHFLTWRAKAASAGASPYQATRHAYRSCGVAMVETSLVCGLGLAVFTASGFRPISRFGACMSVLLALALFADLVVLPAILHSPLGWFFDRTATSTKQASEI